MSLGAHLWLKVLSSICTHIIEAGITICDSVIPISIILIDVIIMWAMNASDNDCKGKAKRDRGKLSVDATCIDAFDCLTTGLTYWAS